MIGQRIKKVREEKGYSISRLAKKAGISKSYLSYIERDMQKNPSLHLLKKIAAPLGLSVEQLLNDRQDEISWDDEWKNLFYKAVQAGMTKSDFIEYVHFLRFKSKKRE